MNPSIVLNVLLNLFFLLVLKMTVNGVALATVLSNVISSVLLFRKLLLTTQPVQVERKYFQFDLTVFKRILQIGLQSAVFAITNIAVQSAINSLGTVMLAYPISLGLAAICFICLNDQSIFTLDSLHFLTRCQ